jgi:tetratricopeptide (TPR) repeat protein
METSHEKDAMQSVMARTLRQAVIQHQASVFDRAEELYQSILQIDPNHPGANHSMGVLFEQRNQAEASLLHFSIALQGDPAQRQYWLSYIDALSRAGRLDTAREVLAFARQHDLDGDDVDALARYLDDDAKLSEDANHQQPLRIVETSSNAGDVHHLVSALESCARGDIYWANEFFYRWLSAGGADAETGEAAGEGIQVQAGNSQFNIHIKHALLSSKLLFLNDFVVDGVFPGAAVALARWLSKMGDHERALSIVKSTLIVHRALGNVRGFMILENPSTGRYAGTSGTTTGIFWTEPVIFCSSGSIFNKPARLRYVAVIGCPNTTWVTSSPMALRSATCTTMALQLPGEDRGWTAPSNTVILTTVPE